MYDSIFSGDAIGIESQPINNWLVLVQGIVALPVSKQESLQWKIVFFLFFVH